jgi:hypothetical protein
MNPRTTALLALVAILLGGFIYFYEIRGESARQGVLDDEKRIHSGLDADQVDAVEFTTEDGIEARFERREGRWSVVSPLADLADATALDAIANAVTNLPRAGVVASPAELDQYGLAGDTRIVRFEVSGESLGLRIGRSTPVGGHVYVARLGDDEVAYVESYRLNSLKHDLDDLRDRRLFGFDEGAVRTLRISWPSVGGETEVALARDESGEWQMGVPATGPADQQTLRELLSDLSFMRAKGFVDERSEASDRALSLVAVTFHWTLVGDHVERRALIGGAFEDGRIVEGPSGRLHTIDMERMDDFKRTVNDYRFKMLSDFELAEARRLILEFTDEPEQSMRVESVLVGAGWAGDEPQIDPTRASDLVRELASLRAAGIVADEMGPNELASLGLLPPRVQIRVEDRSAPEEQTQVLAEIAIGRLDATRGLFAQRVGEPTVFVLPPSAVESIPHSLASFVRDFEASSDAAAPGEVELDPGVLEADPLEGEQFP